MDGVGTIVDGSWCDEFAHLNDRLPHEPLALPQINSTCRVVLVRHGQSTWNAEGRMQGCSDISVLTEKGQGQAAKTRDMLMNVKYDALHHSPLKRAAETAQIVWGDGRDGSPVHVHASLREIDLYTFQGLLKNEGVEKYPDEYALWKDTPADFAVDVGNSVHRPVVELWYRGSLAWQHVLEDADGGVAESRLVVAHNAINQAMICTALGLPPRFFRKVLQSNAAASALTFSPASEEGGQVGVSVGAINATPGVRSLRPRSGAPAQVLLVRHVDVDSKDGYAEASRVAVLLRKCSVSTVCACTSRNTLTTAGALVEELRAKPPPIGSFVTSAETLDDLEGGESLLRTKSARLLVMENLAAPEGEAWQRSSEAWAALCEEADAAPIGSSLVAFASAEVIAAIVCRALGVEDSQAPATIASLQGDMPYGALSCILRPKGGTEGFLRCYNTGTV